MTLDAVDGRRLTAWLAVTALERIGVTRWTARFPLVPLVVLLEGILLVMVTAAASFLGYEVIRRSPLLRPLFGLERGAPRAAGGAAPGAGERAAPTARPLAREFAVPQDIN